MKNDFFIRVLLVVVTILLGLNLISPKATNPVVSCATNSIEYKVDCIGVLFDLKQII